MVEIPDNDDGRALPDWFMPPAMIGGHVTGPVVIARSAGLVVAIRQVLAYPTGVEFDVQAHTRGGAPVAEPADFTGHHQRLRFRLRLGDGTEAVLDDEAGLRAGRGPMLVVNRSESGSGPDGRADVRQSLWLWPLPPPGPLTVTCAWPDQGLADTSVVLDGAAVRAAAELAQPY